MGKNKLMRWAELGTLNNVIQPDTSIPAGTDHSIKGRWNSEIFRNDNPVVLELACGKGEYTVGLAEIFPGRNFIGVDIKGARMWRGARIANEKCLTNVAFLRTRIEFINCFFASDEVHEIWIVFPDPFPGKKNSNKRLTCPWFLNIYRSFLKNKGVIHLKTDNAELFRYTSRLVEDNGIELLYSTNDFHSAIINDRTGIKRAWECMPEKNDDEDILIKVLSIKTHYETGFLKEGLPINYMAFRLEKEKNISYGWEKTGK
ncbi:MAG: tRNA (guanosine(46)-N7)-methyltransferase TrmB [Bacteroidota bacterium]|nr:tRNA (guanosine(46)-N7)-methyltransferase TrmB [Bacteroidota bacterium]